MNNQENCIVYSKWIVFFLTYVATFKMNSILFNLCGNIYFEAVWCPHLSELQNYQTGLHFNTLHILQK